MNINMNCPRCGLDCHFRSTLLTHLKRVKPCESKLCNTHPKELITTIMEGAAEKKYICKVCKKGFINKKSKYEHQRKCKDFKEETYHSVELLAHQLANLQAEVLELRSHGTSSSVTNNNNTQNIHINVNAPIKLRDFGCENMEAIPTSLIQNLFLDLRFRDLLENLHCDPDYPENHNVRIKSTKRELLEIYRNNKWDVMTFVSGLNELLLQGQRIFKDYYRKNKVKILEEDMDEGDLIEILRQLDAIERLNDDDIKPIRKEIQLLLESYRGQMVVG